MVFSKHLTWILGTWLVEISSYESRQRDTTWKGQKNGWQADWLSGGLAGYMVGCFS